MQLLTKSRLCASAQSSLLLSCDCNIALALQATEQAALAEAAQDDKFQSTVQSKDAQIEELLTERGRLEAALASIKGQITSVASPAQPGPAKATPLVRASVDSATLRQATLMLTHAVYCLD